MAHAIFHFGVGLAAGVAATLPPLAGKLRRGDKLAGTLGRRFALAYGLGALAVFPGILRALGLPAGFLDGWWMNVCVFYPLLNRLKHGGMLIGEILVVTCFVLQYAVALVALRRRLKRSSA